jgi:hypothetical protein
MIIAYWDTNILLKDTNTPPPLSKILLPLQPTKQTIKQKTIISNDETKETFNFISIFTRITTATISQTDFDNPIDREE